MPRRPASFTQADIARALRAVAQVGMRAAVQLDPDGKMWIIPNYPYGENPQGAKEQVAEGREAVL